MDALDFLLAYYTVILTGSWLRQNGMAEWWPEFLDIIEHTRVLLGLTTKGDSQ